MTMVNGSGTRVNGEPFQVVERVGPGGPIPADSFEVLGDNGDGANFLMGDMAAVSSVGRWYRWHCEGDVVTLQRATAVAGVAGEPTAWTDVFVAGAGSVSPARATFISSLLQIFGATPLLWLPIGGTTDTDSSRNGKVITFSGTTALFDVPPSALGNGVQIDFNGTDEEADTPDSADLSFGNGAADSAMTVLVLCKSDVGGAIETLVAKWDETMEAELREWKFELDADDAPTFQRGDESVFAAIGRSAPAITIGEWTLLGATSDDSENSAGINIYQDGVEVDDTDVESGVYVAEEDLATVVTIAHQIGTAAIDQFFDGQIALVAIVARELSADEMWQVKELVNGYFNLSL